MKCVKCGSSALVDLSSVDKRLCADCLYYNDWLLKPNQASVLIEGKTGEQAVLGEDSSSPSQ